MLTDLEMRVKTYLDRRSGPASFGHRHDPGPAH
jgi:hypothetical protein